MQPINNIHPRDMYKALQQGEMVRVISPKDDTALEVRMSQNGSIISTSEEFGRTDDYDSFVEFLRYEAGTGEKDSLLVSIQESHEMDMIYRHDMTAEEMWYN